MAAALLLGAWAVTMNWGDASFDDRKGMDGPDLRAFVLVLVVQSIPYLSAVLASVASALPIPARWIGHGYRVIDSSDDYATIIDVPPPTAPYKAAKPE